MTLSDHKDIKNKYAEWAELREVYATLSYEIFRSIRLALYPYLSIRLLTWGWRFRGIDENGTVHFEYLHNGYAEFIDFPVELLWDEDSKENFLNKIVVFSQS